MRKEKTEDAPEPYLTEYLRLGLDVAFVGAAASVRSAHEGHWYAGPTNKFYLLLHQSGLTPRQLRPEEDSSLPDFGIGLTCLHRYRSTTANHLLPPTTPAERQTVKEKILQYAPRFACFNGKDVYQMATGKICMEWGEQTERIGESRVWVIHSTSARADHWAAERLALYREMREELGRHQALGIRN